MQSYVYIQKRKYSILPPTLTLNGINLQQVQEYRYLGVTLTNNMSWKVHIHSVGNKARRLIGVLYRSFQPYAQPCTMIKLYKAFIRPHLEYASVVWSPHLLGEIKHLEKVQKFALRVCFKCWERNVSYDDLLKSGRLQTLSSRRTVARLCHLFKILSGKTEFPLDKFIPWRMDHPSRIIRESSIQPLKCKTDIYKSSFLPKVIDLWNTLLSRAGPMNLDLTNFSTIAFITLVLDLNIC